MRLVLILAWLAAMPAAAVAERLSVSFINPGGSTEFWGDVAQTMRAAADDLDIALEVIDTNRDRVRMVAAAQALAERSVLPDYVVIVNELQQAPQMLAALAPTGVPVFVLLNRLTEAQRGQVAGLETIVASIVPDNEIAGYEMAQSVIAGARAAGRDEDGVALLALLGDAATPAALAREAGLRRALAEHDDVTLVRAIPVLWSRETAQERTARVLQRFELDAVWAANDQIALGAQAAVRDAGGMPGETVIFAGLNWSAEGLEAVRAGTMTLTHGGHFFAGAWAMVMLRDLADGALAPASHLHFPMSAVTAETVELFLDRFGDRAWEGIDFAAFSRARSGRPDYDFSSGALIAAAAGQP